MVPSLYISHLVKSNAAFSNFAATPASGDGERFERRGASSSQRQDQRRKAVQQYSQRVVAAVMLTVTDFHSTSQPFRNWISSKMSLQDPLATFFPHSLCEFMIKLVVFLIISLVKCNSVHLLKISRAVPCLEDLRARSSPLEHLRCFRQRQEPIPPPHEA